MQPFGGIPSNTPVSRWAAVEKQITYTGGAGLGAVGNVPLFTVTGDVLVLLVKKCTTDLTGPAANVATGVPGAANLLVGWQAAEDINAGSVQTDDPAIGTGGQAAPKAYFISGGLDIQETVADANITGGVVKYYAYWAPFSSDGNVVAA